MRKLEHNDMFHPQVLVHPLHPLRPLRILIHVVMMVEQPVHDISFKALQEIHLALQLLGIHVEGERFANIGVALVPRRDVIEMPICHLRIGTLW